MEHIRILIADDQHLFAEGLRYVIPGESRQTIEVCGIAENGMAAVELAERLRPDVILMDIRMPVMDGVVATEQIHKRFPEIKIMMLTTFDDDDLVFDALSYGANGYVLKSIEPADLVSAILAVQKGALYVSPSVGYKLVHMMQSGADGVTTASDRSVSEILAKNPVLSLREAEVLAHVAAAKRNQEIAGLLFISEKTVRNHLSAIYDKLDIHNRLSLINHVVGMGTDS